MIWAIIGMSAGAYLASELVMPWLNFDIAQITFGRLRPFHETKAKDINAQHPPT
jgi:cytochrome c oxidase cbb3-type subunit 1